MMILIHFLPIFHKNRPVHGFYFHNTSPVNFYLLHTHFFSFLVYHVPIFSCNPTVYTLCTVSTWGSVYICQYDSGCRCQSTGDCHTLLLTARKLIGQRIQTLIQPKGLYNLLHEILVDLATVQLNG